MKGNDENGRTTSIRPRNEIHSPKRVVFATAADDLSTFAKKVEKVDSLKLSLLFSFSPSSFC